jgi:phosphatidate cytidylyltransferase
VSTFLLRALTTFFLAPTFVVLIVYAPLWVFYLVILSIALAIIFTEWPYLFSYKNPLFWVLMPLYPLAPFLAMIELHRASRLITMLLFSSVTAHDTGSYIIGKLFGRNKICTKISPGKTWEGFMGGTLFTLVTTSNFFYYFTSCKNSIIIIIIALSISGLALIGDLFESYLKRQAHLKDSGSILPGHGGLLDRLDALMCVSLVAYFFRTILLEILVC